jgi:phosphatidate cytidylyltransferase
VPASARHGGGRNPVIATATGLAFGAVAVACFLLGAVTTLALVALVLSLAAGEVLATLRRAGTRPFAPLALASVPAFAISAYVVGAAAVSWVLIALLVLGVIWLLAAGPRVKAVRDLSVTVLVACWVGVPGAFAGLLLSPARFADRHGVAFCFAVVATVVAHDVGSYVIGHRFGRHKLAPRVSPGKTWEGVAGGTAFAFALALGALDQIHPITIGAAAALASIVTVLAPLGDLAESLVKRDLAVKDMGRLLPEHGGVFDRVDAMLFVLPAAYGLFSLLHLA